MSYPIFKPSFFEEIFIEAQLLMAARHLFSKKAKVLNPPNERDIFYAKKGSSKIWWIARNYYFREYMEA